MAECGKYYNPEYPNTSNDWTRKWDKSWLLRKDKYLLMYANEKERKKVYRWNFIMMFFLFFPLFVLAISWSIKLHKTGLTIDSIKLAILYIFILFSLKRPKIWMFILSAFVFLYVPIEINVDKDISLGLILFNGFLLVTGITQMIYYFNCLYLKKFDDVSFEIIYAKLASEDDKVLREELLNSFKDKVSTNPLVLKIFQYGALYFFYDLVVLNLLMGSMNDNILKLKGGFATKYLRMTFLYSWLYWLKPTWFKNNQDTKIGKPLKVFAIYSLFMACVVILGIVICAIKWTTHLATYKF